MPIYAAIFKGEIKIVNTCFNLLISYFNASDNTVVILDKMGTQYDDAITVYVHSKI